MRVFLTLVFILISSTIVANENNTVLKHCVQNTSDYNEAASCYFDWKQHKNAQELAELKDFLKHNPRYRFPGQSLNKCWGKPREMPFESAGIETTVNGMRAWVNYKDKIPAGC